MIGQSNCFGFTTLLKTTLVIIFITIRIIIRLSSSPLLESQSLHRREDNKLAWLTYKVCGVFIVCWLPQIVTTSPVLFGARGNTVTDVLVIATTISYYFYAMNPVLNCNMLKRRALNNVTVPTNRQPKNGMQGNISNDDKAKKKKTTVFQTKKKS